MRFHISVHSKVRQITVRRMNLPYILCVRPPHHNNITKYGAEGVGDTDRRPQAHISALLWYAVSVDSLLC